MSYIPLTTGGCCKVSTFDHDRLLAFGVPCDDWYAHRTRDGSCVVAAPSRNLGRVRLALVSDLIYNVARTQTLSYRNGDPLDLTRSNVVRVKRETVQDQSNEGSN